MTREQTAVIMYRVFVSQLNIDLRSSFSDLWQASAWAGGAISVLGGNRIINGYSDGSFKPHNTIKRIEFITILDRLMPEPHKIVVNVPSPADFPDFDRTDPNQAPADPYAHLVGKKLIALTFDDGPHGTLTPRLLDALDAGGIKVTFFLTGANVAAYPSIAKRAADEGHQLANHSYSHKSLTSFTNEGIQNDINYASYIIENATGVRPTVLRPPFGSNNARVRSAVGMPLIMWSIDPQDWSGKSSDTIYSHITSRARDGDIILMHDIVQASIIAVPRIIEKLKQDGFVFVTIDELIAVRGGAQAGELYYSFR